MLKCWLLCYIYRWCGSITCVCVYVVSLAGTCSRPTSLQEIQHIHIHTICCGLVVRFAGCCPLQLPANRTHNPQLHTDNLKTKAPNTTGSNHLYNTLELLMMSIMVPETCWASNKTCNKNHLLHLVGILFPHIIICACIVFYVNSGQPWEKSERLNL